MTRSPNTVSARRRAILASLAVGTTAFSSGCIRRLRAITGWQSSKQVTLRIKTVPADADPYALRIARHISGWLRTAGIDTQVTPMAYEELSRQVLLNHEFDLFVARTPAQFQTPDALYSLLHSRFATASGWQNPFGYTNLNVDDLLETQRHSNGERRREAVSQLQQTVATTQPFTVVAFPDDIRAVRSDRYTNWRDLRSPLGYLALERADRDKGGSNTAQARNELRTVITDPRPTENLNPLVAEFRDINVLTGLLYDALGYTHDGETIEPWLADSWELSKGSEGPRARVRLRPDLTWHDGESLTSEDVAFTYAFLADTTLGSGVETESKEDERNSIPSPRFQGRSDLVSNVNALDSQTVEFQFVECNPRIATRAFTVPILPKHVWKNRTGPASIGGIEVGPATEALVMNNIPPVGSGPLAFVRNSPKERLVLEAFDEHFLAQEDVSGLPSRLAGGPAFDRLRMRVVGSGSTAIKITANGETDATGTAVGAGTIPRIGRANPLNLLVRRSGTFYLVGYNTRRSPLTNPRIRNALARLIDKAYLTEEVFGGYAQPAVSALDGTDWLPSDLQWNGTDPVTPFLGDNGELDVESVRDAFRNAGYRYDNDGKLVEE